MDKPLHTLSLIEAAEGIKNRRFTSEAYTQALLARIASLDEGIQAWAWLKPAEAIKAARLSDDYLQLRRCARPPPGDSPGGEGHLRHRRRAHGDGFSRLCRPCPDPVGPGDRTARGPGGLCHGEDRHHRMRLSLPREDPQSLESAAYAGRVVQRLRRGGRGGLRPGRPGHADQRLRHPARRVLRGRGLQADPGPHPHRRRPDLQPHPGSAGHLHPQRGGCRLARGLPDRRGREALVRALRPLGASASWRPSKPPSGNRPRSTPSRISGKTSRRCETAAPASRSANCPRSSASPTGRSGPSWPPRPPSTWRNSSSRRPPS